MWEQEYTKLTTEINGNDAWNVFKNVKDWDKWNNDIEWADVNETFTTGSKITMKLKNGPKVNIQIVACEEPLLFRDLTKFPLAKMYGTHMFEETKEGLKLTVGVKVIGPLSFLWRKLVAQNMAKRFSEDVENLISYTKGKNQ